MAAIAADASVSADVSLLADCAKKWHTLFLLEYRHEHILHWMLTFAHCRHTVLSS